MHCLNTILFLVLVAFTVAAPVDHEVKARVTGPQCFNICTGVNQTVYTQAIDLFCAQYDNVHISHDGTAGTFPGIRSTIPYAPTPGTGEQGEILLDISASATPGCGTVVVSALTCKFNFYVPINGCNLAGVDGKQGGIFGDPCLWFTINPHPNGC